MPEDATSCIFNSEGMCGIVNNFKSMFYRYGFDCLDITSISKYMHRHNCLCF